MADKTGTVNRYREMIRTVGKSTLSAIYPNDFEVYLCAFELVEKGKTIDYFVFPIQPSQIQKVEPTRTNIKSSMAGVTVLKNSSIIPKEIMLKGNFGRNFKILTTNGVAFTNSFSKKQGLTLNTPIFSVGIKTGYGATKLLQNILNESNNLSSNGENRQLYFYNMALGESYLVVVNPNGVIYNQSQDMNMIWQYSINLSVLAPLSEVADALDKDSKLSRSTKMLGRNVVQKSVNIVAKEVSQFLTRNNGITTIAAS